PVVPTTAWMPWSISQATLSAVAEGTVRSIATSAPASATAVRSSPRPIRATSSRSSASSTARQAAAPMRPAAPSTATRVGRAAGGVEAEAGVMAAPEVVAVQGGTGTGTVREAGSALGADLAPGAVRAGQARGEVPHVGDVDLPDAGEGLVDAGVAAVDQLDGPESAHPGAGVLEAEREGAGDLALRPGQLELLDTRLAHAA